MALYAIVLRLITGREEPALKVANQLWAPAMIWVTGSKLSVEGVEHLDLSRPYIFLMNHQSMIDIPSIYVALPIALRFIAKKELKSVPFLGWSMALMGMVFIDRNNSQAAKESVSKAAKLIREGKSIVAYPEGTRSVDGRIKPFKKGMFVLGIEAQVPIVPIAIEGSRFATKAGTLKAQPADIKFKIGEPIDCKGLSLDDRDRLADLVRSRIIDLHASIGGQPPL